jgi:hypothetical protein
MGQSVCLECGVEELAEEFTVDRLGICHWFRQCPCCGRRRPIQHIDPACNNPYAQVTTPARRPDVPQHAPSA